MPRPKLSTMSMADLRQEIERRQNLLPKLISQRNALSREIAELQGLAAPEARKADQSEAAPKGDRKRRRAKNKVGLADALAVFVNGKAMVTVGQAMEGVLSAGYRSTSKTFRQLVNKALLTDKRFKKVGRGEFTLRA